MINTSGDFLNVSIGVSVIALVVFLCILCFYGILILRDISKVVEDVEEVTNKVKKTIVEPLRAADFLIEKARPYIEMVLDKKKSSKKKKKKK
jgi:uncharacterized protein YoxC